MMKVLRWRRQAAGSFDVMRCCLQTAAAACASTLPLGGIHAESFDPAGHSRSVMVGDSSGESATIVEGSSFADFTGSQHITTFSDPSLRELGWPSEPTASCTTGCGKTPCRCGACGGDPPGFLQKVCAAHDKAGACWIGRADALILWRNAPPDRPLIQTADGADTPLLNADQLDSTAAAGPRVSLIRRDKCTGNAWETTYLRAANFRSQRLLPFDSEAIYALAPPGIYGNNASQPFTDGTVNLGSRIQSLEFNRLVAAGPSLRWLAGFRWVEWQESFSLQNTNSQFEQPIEDVYQTDTINSLYGGQIGADMTLLTLRWLRVDSVVKAGAYYNNAVQRSSYTTNEFGFFETVPVRVADSPLSCGFLGEVGITGVMPITDRIDFRFGYLALWLSGIAQPTQQLSGQQLVPGEDPQGSLNDKGGVVVQGVTVGLEGRW